MDIEADNKHSVRSRGKEPPKKKTGPPACKSCGTESGWIFTDSFVQLPKRSDCRDDRRYLYMYNTHGVRGDIESIKSQYNTDNKEC
jgi:hypothetical protein